MLDRPIRRTAQDCELTTAINVTEKKSILITVKRACISHNKPFTINTPNLQFDKPAGCDLFVKKHYLFFDMKFWRPHKANVDMAGKILTWRENSAASQRKHAWNGPWNALSPPRIFSCRHDNIMTTRDKNEAKCQLGNVYLKASGLSTHPWCVIEGFPSIKTNVFEIV